MITVELNLENKIQRILAGRKKAFLEEEGLQEAAVLIPFFQKEGEYHILFTRRTDKMKHHKGQISFPGGRHDQEDKDLLTTALRETWEEMGIRPEDVHIVGELDDFCTVTDFCVAPFVGFIPYPYPFCVNPHEIEEVLEVPFSALLEKGKFRQEIHQRRGKPFPVFFYQYQKHTIWGATARILKQLLDLLAEDERP